MTNRQHIMHHVRVAALTACLTAFLTGCGSADGTVAVAGSPTETNAASGLDLTAHINPQNASVSLPSDRLLVTTSEEEIIRTAEFAAVAVCVRAKGVPWPSAHHPNDDPVLNAWHRYGPWTADIAQKFAFVKPMTERGLITQGIVIPENLEPIFEPLLIVNLTETQLAASDECYKDPQVLQFNGASLYNPGPWMDAVLDSYTLIDSDPRAQELFDELGTCYAEYGMEMDPENPGFVVGANTTANARYWIDENGQPASEPTDEPVITEEQVIMALQTVECKDSIDFTNRIANLIAEKQAPGVEKYSEELVSQRQHIDDLVASARDYMATHPDAFEEVR